jgi:hypothetical protein
VPTPTRVGTRATWDPGQTSDAVPIYALSSTSPKLNSDEDDDTEMTDPSSHDSAVEFVDPYDSVTDSDRSAQSDQDDVYDDAQGSEELRATPRSSTSNRGGCSATSSRQLRPVPERRARAAAAASAAGSSTRGTST